MKIPVSVLILTRDEEENLPGCLEAVRWSDDVVVLDSASTDTTRHIAVAAGCRVIERTFDNWAAHQNWAVKNIKFKHDWVLNLDADERLSADFVLEVAAAIQDPTASAFRMRRRDYFRGQWLKHATFYPTWLVRLYKPELVEFRRLVNPVTHVNGAIGSLRAHIEHWPFSKGISHWVQRHNSYSSFEAREYSARPNSSSTALVSHDPNERRMALKAFFSRLPARPLIKFLYLYLFHGGLLDGRAGLDYCLLQSIYEYFIALKIGELYSSEREFMPAVVSHSTRQI